MNRILGNKANFVSIFLPAVILMLVACAGQQLDVKPISKSENPQELINQLDNDIALAYKNQLNVLAPTWFGRANSLPSRQPKKAWKKGISYQKFSMILLPGGPSWFVRKKLPRCPQQHCRMPSRHAIWRAMRERQPWEKST